MKRVSESASQRLGFVICHLSFVIFLLWRPLFAGETFFWGTPLLQFVPWQRMAATMYRAGHLPLWNPLVGCGAPLAANYQTAAFYPLNVLYLLLPAEVALSWTTAFHLALAGWGMYGWGRAVGLDRFPAFIGALSLSGSGFLVARVALFPSIAFTFPWLAVWLYRAEVLVRSRRLRDALWLGLALGLGLLAGHAQTAFYGGLLLAAYLIFRTLSDVRSRFTFHVSRFWSLLIAHWSLIACSLVIGVGLAAVQLLPTAELVAQSRRAGGVNYDFAMTYSLWPWRLITFAAPDFFGNPGRGDYWGYATYWEGAGYVGVLPLLLAVEAVLGRERGRRGDKETGGRGDKGTRRRGDEETGGRGDKGTRRRGDEETRRQGDEETRGRGDKGTRRRGDEETRGQGDKETRGQGDKETRRQGDEEKGDEGGRQAGFWVVSAVIALVLALGRNTPVFPFLFRHIPGFNMFQAPARWLALTTVALAALAALGAQRWLAGRLGRRQGMLGVVVGAALLIGGLAAPRLIPGGRLAFFGAATIRLGGTLAVAGTLALLRRDAVWWRAAVGAFVVMDLLLFGWPLAPTVDRSLYHGGTEAADFLHSEPGLVRVYWPADPAHLNREYDAEQRVKFGYLTFDDFGPRDVDHWWKMREALLPNVGMLDGVASANNFDPLLVGRYAALLEAAVEAPALLRVMGVTHVASDRPWPEGERIEEWRMKDGEDVVGLYRLTGALGRAWVVPAARDVSPDRMLAALASPVFDPSAEVLLEQPVPGIQHPASNIRYQVTLQDTPNGVTIHAVLDTPGYLVLADTWYPGWQATVNGVPAEVLRANYAFRAVWLEAGEHVVEFVYRPRAVMAGVGLSAASLVCWLVCCLVSRLSRQVE